MLFFENIEVKLEIYNGCSNVHFLSTPWDYLIWMAYGIVKKIQLPGKYYNEKEIELYPLFKEIASLSSIMRDDMLDDIQSFDILKQLINQYSDK